MRGKRSLSWWIIFLKSSPKGENVHIWRQNAFWGPQPPPEVPCNRKSKHFPLKTLFDGFPFSFAFRLERRHFSTPDTGLRAGRRRKRKPPGALPAGEPREGPARSQLPETQQLWSCAKVWPGQGAAALPRTAQSPWPVRCSRRPLQPSRISRQVVSKSPVYQGSATSPGRSVKSSRRWIFSAKSPPQMRFMFRRLA